MHRPASMPDKQVMLAKSKCPLVSNGAGLACPISYPTNQVVSNNMANANILRFFIITPKVNSFFLNTNNITHSFILASAKNIKAYYTQGVINYHSVKNPAKLLGFYSLAGRVVCAFYFTLSPGLPVKLKTDK